MALLEVRDLRTSFHTRDGIVRAVDAFEVPPHVGAAARRWRANTPPEPATVARGLQRQARLRLPGAAKDEALRARCSRLLARAVALEPNDARAQAELAWATRDLTLADRTIERWPDDPHVRRSRLRARLDAGWKRPDVQEDAAWLAERGLAAGLDLLFPASVRADAGDLDGAWALLVPWLDTPGPDARVLELAAIIAQDRGDAAAVERLRARQAVCADVHRRQAQIQNQVFRGGDLAAFDARLRDLPPTELFHRWRLELACQMNDASQALLSLGRYLLAVESPEGRTFLQVAHTHAYRPLQDATIIVADLDAAVAADPASPVGHLARAARLSSAHHRAPDHVDHAEFAHQAAEHALEGVALEPQRAGPLLLAAFCLVDAGDLALAGEALDSAQAALGRETDFIAFVRARAAAARGDAAGAVAALRRMTYDPCTYHSMYRFDTDPAFQPVLADPAFVVPDLEKKSD